MNTTGFTIWILFALFGCLFLGIAFPANSDGFKVEYAMEFGYQPVGTVVMYKQPSWRTPDFAHFSGSFYTDLEIMVGIAGINTLGFYVGGGVRTEMWGLNNELSFWPHLSNYRFLASFRYGPIEIGFRHFCIHPVVPMLALIQPVEQIWEGAYEEVFIRVSNK